MFLLCPVCVLATLTFNLSVEEMSFIKRTVKAGNIPLLPGEHHEKRENNEINMRKTNKKQIIPSF